MNPLPSTDVKLMISSPCHLNYELLDLIGSVPVVQSRTDFHGYFYTAGNSQLLVTLRLLLPGRKNGCAVILETEFERIICDTRPGPGTEIIHFMRILHPQSGPRPLKNSV